MFLINVLEINVWPTWLLVLIVYSISTFLTYITRVFVNQKIRLNSKLLFVNPTNFKFLLNSIGLIYFLIATVIIFNQIPVLKSYSKAIFASAGIFAAIIGFASQKAFTNIISGIFILIYKPFKIGETIEIEKLSGKVEDITLRHTIIKDFENRRIIIPNSKVSEETIINNNLNDERICKKINFKIPYENNMDKVMETIKNYFESVEGVIDVRTQKEINDGEQMVNIKVTEWQEGKALITAWVWANSSTEGYNIQCEGLKNLIEIFKQNNIVLPSAIHLDNYKPQQVI